MRQQKLTLHSFYGKELILRETSRDNDNQLSDDFTLFTPIKLVIFNEAGPRRCR